MIAPFISREEYECPKETLAYLAGFFDGEGCVSLSRYQKNQNNVVYSLIACITNTNPLPLKLYKKYFGGCLFSRPSKRWNSNRRKVWIWSSGGKIAEKFLLAIYEHLIIKKEEVALGLEFRELLNIPGKKLSNKQLEMRKDIKEKMQILKMREWDDV